MASKLTTNLFCTYGLRCGVRLLRHVCFWLISVGAIASGAGTTGVDAVLIDTNEIPLLPAKHNQLLYDLQWKILAGDDALQANLPYLAERLYRAVYDLKELPEAQAQEVGLKIVSALISQRNFVEADHFLRELALPEGAALALREALLGYQLGDQRRLVSNLALIDEEELSAADLPWFTLLNGLREQQQGNVGRAEAFFKQAQEQAQEGALRAQFDTLIYRGQLLAGNASEDLAAELKTRVDRYRGQRAGFPFVRQYAVVLNQLGRKSAALAVLRNQLRLVTRDDIEERDRLWFLIGLISGEQTSEGQAALREVVESGTDREMQQVALYLLARGSRLTGRTDELLAFLQRLIDRSQQQVSSGLLLDEILLLKAQIELGIGHFKEAQDLAEQLLADFPGSSLRKQAIRILAYIALDQSPPRYRTAADYLSRLRQETEPGEARAHLGVLVADCYFLNADYVNAAGVYNSVLQEELGSLQPGPVLYQLVLSDIRAGRLDEAREILDQAVQSLEIDLASRWKAEWNFVMALDAIGKSAEAFRRIDSLLKGSGEKAVPTELRLRLMWMEALLSLKIGQPERTPVMVDAIISLLDIIPSGTIEDEQRAQIGGHALLLKGQALLAQEQGEQGLAVFNELRSQYSGSDSAILSYLIEARYLMSVERAVDALQRLRELAEQYPTSPYAPIALYEAILNIERRGDLGAYQQAGEVLRQFIRNYPDHPLIYYARLVQGDLHRRLGEFGAAQKVYENLINSYPDHPDRVRAEIARADCLLAQASKDPIWLEDAAASLERMFDLPNASPDLRVEAGSKWGFALAQQGNRIRAQEIYWLVISRFLLDRAAADSLGEVGRYWMARTIFELGRLFEEDNRFQDAREVYDLIVLYQLPGRSLARAKLQSEAS